MCVNNGCLQFQNLRLIINNSYFHNFITKQKIEFHLDKGPPATDQKVNKWKKSGYLKIICQRPPFLRGESKIFLYDINDFILADWSTLILRYLFALLEDLQRAYSFPKSWQQQSLSVVPAYVLSTSQQLSRG